MVRQSAVDKIPKERISNLAKPAKKVDPAFLSADVRKDFEGLDITALAMRMQMTGHLRVWVLMSTDEARVSKADSRLVYTFAQPSRGLIDLTHESALYKDFGVQDERSLETGWLKAYKDWLLAGKETPEPILWPVSSRSVFFPCIEGLNLVVTNDRNRVRETRLVFEESGETDRVVRYTTDAERTFSYMLAQEGKFLDEPLSMGRGATQGALNKFRTRDLGAFLVGKKNRLPPAGAIKTQKNTKGMRICSAWGNPIFVAGPPLQKGTQYWVEPQEGEGGVVHLKIFETDKISLVGMAKIDPRLAMTSAGSFLIES